MKKSSTTVIPDLTRKCLTILLCLNLLFSSFYPFFIASRVVYAQEEWGGEESGGEEAPAGEPEPAWEPEPVAEPEPTPEPAPAYIPWWEDYPVAETVPAEVPQEPLADVPKQQVDSCLMYGEGCQYTVPGYVQPTPEPLPFYVEPTPEPTPAPVEPTPLPTLEAIPQQQIDSCLQYGEGCGVVSQPITDASSQDQATADYWKDYDQTYASTTNNEYEYSETREESSAGQGVVQEMVSIPDTVAETSGNWWDGATSFIGTQAGNFGQFITSPFAARTGYAENINKEAEKVEQAVHDQDQQQAEDLNKAINTPTSEKLAALKEQFGLQNTPNEEAIQIIKDAYSLRGLDFNPEDGSVQKSPDDSYTPSDYSIDFTRARNPAVSDKQIESCLQFGEGCANPNWTPEELAQRRQQGQDAIKEFTLNLSQIYSTGGKFLENVNTVNEMQPLYNQTGMKERTQARLSSYTGSEKVPDYFTNGAFANGTVTPQEIEDDMKANPDLGSPELNAAREQLLELAKEKEERGKEITLEVSAAMLMGSVGGSNAVPILKKAGEKIAARAGEGVLEKELVGNLGDLAAGRVSQGVKEAESVFVAPTQSALEGIEDLAVADIKRKFRAEIPSDVGIVDALVKNNYPPDAIKDIVPLIRERLQQELPNTKQEVEKGLVEFMTNLKAVGREVDETTIRKHLAFDNYPEEEIDAAVKRIDAQVHLDRSARIESAVAEAKQEFGSFTGFDEEGIKYMLQMKKYPKEQVEEMVKIIQTGQVKMDRAVISQSTEALVEQTLGRKGTEEELAKVSGWLGEKGSSEDGVLTALDQARAYSKFVESAYAKAEAEIGIHGYYYLNQAPPSVQRVGSVLEYEYKGNPTGLRLGRDTDILGIADALLTQRRNIQILEPIFNRTRENLETLKEIALKRGVDRNVVDQLDIDQLLDPTTIHLQSRSKVTEGLKGGAVGYYDPSDDQIVLRKGILGQRDPTLTHEVLHKNHDLLNGSTGNLEDSGSFYYEDAAKLEEGFTEYMNQEILKEQSRYLNYAFENYGVYPAQVVAIEREIIPAMVQSGMTKQEAERLVWEVGIDGNYTKIVNAVGGAEKMRQILDRVPNITANQLTQRFYARHPLDIAIAVGLVTETAYAGYRGSEFIQNQFVPQKLPWRLIPNVYADEGVVLKGGAISSTIFENQVRLQLVKNIIQRKGRVDSRTVREILLTEILTPEVYGESDGYLFQTGKAGVVEGEVERGIYKVAVNPLPGVDLEVPAVVDLNKDASAILAVKIKKGSGKVEKVASRSDRGLIRTVYADEAKDASGSAQVKVVLTGEQGQVLPWAGVNIKLEKVGQEKTIHLSAGWNLMTLTALPGKPLTASAMLDLIDSQDGQATAVSTLENGAWKTFVSRGIKDYSNPADDFLIEPGKAYFVKALKQSKFTYNGQNFVAPVKLKLASGWNAVGLPILSKPQKASDLGVDTVARWDFGLWDSFVLKDQQKYGHDFNLESSRGYILKVGKEGEFSP